MQEQTKQKEYNKYDKEIEDIDEIEGTDIKVNPDFYIHKALLDAQRALIKDDVKGGLLQYKMLISHIETLCKAGNMLSSDYEQNLKLYKESTEYTEDEEGLSKSVQLAKQKLKLLMTEVFSHKVATGTLKI